MRTTVEAFQANEDEIRGILKNVIRYLIATNPRATESLSPEDIDFFVEELHDLYGVEICSNVYEKEVRGCTLFEQIKYPTLGTYIAKCEEYLHPEDFESKNSIHSIKVKNHATA